MNTIIQISTKPFLMGAFIFSSFIFAQNSDYKVNTEGCLDAPGGQYPSAIIEAECLGIPYVFIHNIIAGQYSLVQLSSGVDYKFTSSLSNDYITISDENGIASIIAGNSSVIYTPASDQIVRIYVHTDEFCGIEEVERAIFLECGETVTITAPDFPCYYGDGLNSNNLEGFSPVDPNITMANSIELENIFTVEEFRFNFGSNSEILDVKINVRADNGNKPGEIIHTIDSSTFSSRFINATLAGLKTYEVTITVPAPFDLAPGKYWIQPVAINNGNPNVNWETTSTGTSGSTYKVSYDSGNNWMDGWGNNTAVFFISGECKNLNTTDLNSNQLKVYPNPVKDVLNISYSKEISNVSIFDLSGKQVYTQAVNKKQEQINIAHLAKGVYIVKAKVNSDVKTFKIVKE